METDYTKSLTKALTILDLFLVSKQELSLTEICKELGMPKAVASRLISTLVRDGFLYQNEPRGKFSLGTKYFRFSGLIKSRIPLRIVASPFLLRLSQRIHEAVFIDYVMGKEDVFNETYQDISLPLNKYTVPPDENSGLSLHGTGIGKIMLADMSEEELERYFHRNILEKLTPDTITDFEELKKQLVIIRKEGIAIDYEEFRIGVNSITAEIRDIESKLIGGVGLAAPSIRLNKDRIRKLIPEIKSCALEISRQMGFNG
jgi:IclR family transcriptional regulator, KDG regulon repressor